MKYDYNKSIQGVDSLIDVKLDKRTKRFLESINRLKSPKILEVGIGGGRFMRKVIHFRPDIRVYGVDISSAAIKELKKSGLQGRYFTADIQNFLPFPPDFFDAVVIMDVLEHLEEPTKAIKEVYRVLNKGAVFHFYVPCENQPFTLDWLFRKIGLGKDFTFRHFGHVQYFSHNDVKKLIFKYFKIRKITYSDHLVSQICYLFVLWLPKVIVDTLMPDKKDSIRDATALKPKHSPLIKLVKIAWVTLLSFPASLIAELEAALLKNIPFTAKGLHVTAVKRSLLH